MLIPIPWSGLAMAIITFPGVIAHEYAHKLFCQITGTKVFRVCYFRFGNPVGYVEHEVPRSVWKHMLIALGPFFFNTTLGCLVGRITVFINTINNFGMGVFVFVAWIAVSIAMHAFPSIGDLLVIRDRLWKKPAPLLAKLIFTPIAAILAFGTIGSAIWLDLAYGLFVVFGLPQILHIG
jgi:hypothetical protein